VSTVFPPRNPPAVLPIGWLNENRRLAPAASPNPPPSRQRRRPEPRLFPGSRGPIAAIGTSASRSVSPAPAFAIPTIPSRRFCLPPSRRHGFSETCSDRRFPGREYPPTMRTHMPGNRFTDVDAPRNSAERDWLDFSNPYRHYGLSLVPMSGQSNSLIPRRPQAPPGPFLEPTRCRANHVLGTKATARCQGRARGDWPDYPPRPAADPEPENTNRRELCRKMMQWLFCGSRSRPKYVPCCSRRNGSPTTGASSGGPWQTPAEGEAHHPPCGDSPLVSSAAESCLPGRIRLKEARAFPFPTIVERNAGVSVGPWGRTTYPPECRVDVPAIHFP